MSKDEKEQLEWLIQHLREARCAMDNAGCSKLRAAQRCIEKLGWPQRKVNMLYTIRQDINKLLRKIDKSFLEPAEKQRREAV